MKGIDQNDTQIVTFCIKSVQIRVNKVQKSANAESFAETIRENGTDTEFANHRRR